MPRRTPTRPIIQPFLSLALATAVPLLAPSAAGAQVAAPRPAIEYDIPAGDLATVLNRFALQSDLSLSVDARQLQGRRSNGLSGR